MPDKQCARAFPRVFRWHIGVPMIERIKNEVIRPHNGGGGPSQEQARQIGEHSDFLSRANRNSLSQLCPFRGGCACFV